MTTVRFRTFKAIEDPEACERFIIGHRRVLEIFDIKMITSNKAVWVDHPNTYVILVESVEESPKVLAGGRIQIADDILPLPIEDAVGRVDKKIIDIVNFHKQKITGEFCGLWNSREIAGYGIGSIFLGWCGAALARALGMDTLFALCAPATVRPSKQVGFEIERSLGDNGYFNYPKLNLIATAMIIPDVQVLSGAIDIVKSTVDSLMQNPIQTKTTEGPKGEITIEYDLSSTFRRLKK
ncbi:MAG: hypothetical protein JST52_02495 [Bacteroidetes bacterium]|nr:hypothetical protein [Bacteroidota bacterium]MBS1741040.1 hypothetical protein [Bacteroidota bacterium]MBS1777045.1 hypothetical protein [Bacteroidota bacterium]